jgi:peptide/nickel transport system permease protein
MVKTGEKKRYLINKTLRYALVIFIIVSINFFLPRMMPGDPILSLVHENRYTDQSIIQEIRDRYGLNDPLHVQYLKYLNGLVHIDLGFSLVTHKNVSDMIADKLFWSLLILFPSTMIGSLLALILGTIAGYKSGGMIDRALTTMNLVVFSMPGFLLAMFFLAFFGFQLRWFPLGNLSTGGLTGIAYILDTVWHMFLPIVVLSLLELSYTFFIVKNSIVQVRGEYHVFVARAKGLGELYVMFRHVFRNTLPQFISWIALSISYMVTGALLIETVFSLPGMGSLIYEAVMKRDYPVLQGAFLVMTLFVIVMNYLAEVLYGVVDPRVGDNKNVPA